MTDPRLSDATGPLRPPLAEMRPPRSHGWVLWALMAGIIVFPLVELGVLIRTGQSLGFGPTLLLMCATSLLGAWLTKREGSRAWRALVDAFRAGRLPASELTDAALVLVGGVLLMLPGFVTDVVGLVFLVPFLRPLARRVVAYAVARQGIPAASPLSRSRTSGPDVIPGEVVDDTPVSGDIVDVDGQLVRRQRP